jgi:clan AA aspartic protease (TIGR02281 family)
VNQAAKKSLTSMGRRTAKLARAVLVASTAVVAPVAAFGPAAALAVAADAKDPLADKGLTKSGTAYVLPDEAAVLDGMKALRDAKAAADKEVKARTVLDGQMDAKQKILKDSDKQWHELETRLPLVTKPEAKNGIIVRMNRLVADHKQALIALKDLEEQAGKLSVSAKTKFVDDLMTLNAKAAAASAKYAAVAADAGVKAAVDKANITANPKLAVGPSPAFAAAVDELKKWRGAIDSEAIPLRAEHGTFTVDVLVNGEQFAMGVDTGASTISLTAEAADKLKLVPTDNDPTVKMRLADGSVIEGREMNLATVRVGRFTVENVRCVVLQSGLQGAPLLLGGSFLNHFIVKLDPAKRQLQLTEIKAAGSKPKAAPAAGGTPPPAAAGK